MNKDKYARIEIRPHTAEDVRVITDYLHPSYRAVHEKTSTAGDSGLLQLFRLDPTDDSFPGFSARWDIRQNAVDIDLHGNDRAASLFKAEKDGYKGHHSTALANGVYLLEITIPGAVIFRGKLQMTGTGIVYLKDDASSIIEEMQDHADTAANPGGILDVK
jgi:hypothetical protein